MTIPNLLLRSGIDKAVQGSPAGIVTDQEADVVFDLGQSWKIYHHIQIFIYSGREQTFIKDNCGVYGQDSPIEISNERPLTNLSVGGAHLGMYGMSSPSISGVFRPCGRYVRVRVTNPSVLSTGGSFGGSANVVLCAYPS